MESISIVMVVLAAWCGAERRSLAAGESAQVTNAALARLLGRPERLFTSTTCNAWSAQKDRWICIGVDEEKTSTDSATFRISVVLARMEKGVPRRVAVADPFVLDPMDLQPAWLIGTEIDAEPWLIAPDQPAVAVRMTTKLNAASAHDGQEDVYLFHPRGDRLALVFHDVAKKWTGERDLVTREIRLQTSIENVYGFKTEQSHGRFDLVATPVDQLRSAGAQKRKPLRVIYRWTPGEGGGSYKPSTGP